jgi:hypothetical protein
MELNNGVYKLTKGAVAFWAAIFFVVLLLYFDATARTKPSAAGVIKIATAWRS